MLDHDQAINTAAKGKALPLGVIDTSSLHNVRLDHAAAHHFEPLAAKHDINLNRRLGKWKEARTETKLHIIAKQFFKKVFKCPLQVRKRYIAVNIHCIELEKLRFVRCISGFVTKNFTRKNSADGHIVKLCK